MFKKLFLVPLVAMVLTGCVTNTITNLTTTQVPRNADGLYPIELIWDSNQQSLRDASVTPYVIVGFESYKMQPTLRMKSRWEATVPISAEQRSINYHFKVDYDYNEMGGTGQASKLSRIYTLEILD